MSDGPPPDLDERPAEASLIFRPAKREKIGLIIGISAPSWAGKTYSALRLARGIAGPKGRIGVVDTERGRALTYADDFDFDHAELNEPFTPARYANAASVSKRLGHDVLIVDSASHEHAGPGGLLEMHEAELNRLCNGSNDYARREAMKMVAWIKPKGEHKAMLQRLLQLNSHLILCFRAEMKTEIQLLKNKAGKLVNTPVQIGFQPVTGKEVLYELTILLGLDQKAPGVPIPIKLADKFKPFVPLDRVLDEATGARLAAWARGENPAPYGAVTQQPAVASTRPAPARPARSEPPPPTQEVPPPTQEPPPLIDEPPPGDPRDEPADEPPPEPSPGDMFPGDMPLEQPKASGKASAAQTAADIIQAFQRVQVRADHFAIVDTKVVRDRIAWLKKNRRDLWEPLDAAMKASWARTAPQKGIAA